MPPVDLAWMAGILEGEGSIRIATFTRSTTGCLCLDIPNGMPEITAAFLDAWGGKRRYEDPPPPRRPYWRWRVNSRQAEACLIALQPYLRTAVYRERVALALEYQAQKVRGPGDHGPAYRARQHGYYLRMRALNQRGRPVESAS